MQNCSSGEQYIVRKINDSNYVFSEPRPMIRETFWNAWSSHKNELRYYKRKILYAFTASSRNVQCPICGWEGASFLDYDCGYGNIYRNAECPVCLSHPRHRLTYLYLHKELQPGRMFRVLHIAPEESLARFLRRKKNIVYVSVDLDPSVAMRQENIEHLSFQDNTFDIVLCLCVLEHVKNDSKAIKELYRVTRKKGYCIIDVPIDYSLEITREDASIQSPKERAAQYWQRDHERLYGRDFSSRLQKAGLVVHKACGGNVAGDEQARRFGLPDYPLHIVYKNPRYGRR